MMSFRPLQLSTLLLFSLLVSVASIGFALVSQYGFHLKPCELCIAQRIPYALVMLLAPLGLWKRKWRMAICVLVGLCFLADSGVAAYHTAVEQHWVPGPEACTDQGGDAPLTLEQIRAKIMNAPIVACDQPQWEYHGITMATMNAVWAFFLFVTVFAALRHIHRRDKVHA